MHDLVGILESAEPRTRKCVIDVLEGLEMFLYGECKIVIFFRSERSFLSQVS